MNEYRLDVTAMQFNIIINWHVIKCKVCHHSLYSNLKRWQSLRIFDNVLNQTYKSCGAITTGRDILRKTEIVLQ